MSRSASSQVLGAGGWRGARMGAYVGSQRLSISAGPRRFAESPDSTHFDIVLTVIALDSVSTRPSGQADFLSTALGRYTHVSFGADGDCSVGGVSDFIMRKAFAARWHCAS